MSITDTTPVSSSKAVPSFSYEQEQGTFSFFSYDPKQEYPAPNGARLVNCLYRSKAGNAAARPNEAMFIPDWITPEVVGENLPQLMEYIISFLQDQEQEMIRAKHKEHTTIIGASQFELPALLEYMTSKGAGARLSGALIEEWITTSGLREALYELYYEKTNSDTKSKQLVEFISGKLKGLASPKVVWSPEEKEKLLPILQSAEQDSIRDKLIARVGAMGEVADSLLDAL